MAVFKDRQNHFKREGSSLLPGSQAWTKAAAGIEGSFAGPFTQQLGKIDDRAAPAVGGRFALSHPMGEGGVRVSVLQKRKLFLHASLIQFHAEDFQDALQIVVVEKMD